LKPVLRKLLVTAGVTVIVLAALELVLRRSVPHCGVTPFRKSELAGLSAEFRPGFSTLYKGHEVSFNSDGFRGPELPPREAGALRVALVGDSFTFGTAVGLEDTLAVSLQDALAERGTRAQVLNLGVPGYCALEVAELVEHRALALDPDVVLYVFFANDVDAPMHWETIPPDAVIDAMQEYPLRSALAEWLLTQVRRTALAAGLQLGRNTPQRNLAQYEQGGGERVRAALTRMQAACENAGVRLALAVYPYPTRVDLNPYRPIDERALADARELGVESLDLLQAFSGERDLSRYQASVFDSHPDGEANRRVAAHLARELWP
jgi:lysophospholipase L1-like esterase